MFLAAAALPSFSTIEEPSGEATRLSVGLPWSPWLVYRERWSRPEAAAAIPTLDYETAIEPQSGSTATMLSGVALLFISRFLKASDKAQLRPAKAAAGRTTSVLGA